MKPLRIAYAWIAWAALACACSGGTAGPASPPFDPFGTEPTDITGDQPGISGLDAPPGGGGGQSISQLCATVCSRVGAVCPGAAGETCVPSCNSVSATYPMCTTQVQGYLSCLATAPLICNGTSIDVPSCDATAFAFESCAQGSSTGSSTPSAGP
jgi:hypothetical protein